MNLKENPAESFLRIMPNGKSTLCIVYIEKTKSSIPMKMSLLNTERGTIDRSPQVQQAQAVSMVPFSKFRQVSSSGIFPLHF